MTNLRILIERLRGMFFKGKMERDLEDEIRAHLEMQTEENERQGMSPQEARRAALRQFGGVEQVKESYREQRGLPLVELTLRDLRYAGRVLLKNPGFTTVVVLTLSLGIGINTAIFSVVNGVLFRPLAYQDPEGIVTLWQRNTQTGSEREPVSPANFLDYRNRNRVFEQVSALRPYGLDYTGGGEPETFHAWLVTAGFFDILGAKALHGRTFLPEEYEAGRGQVVVLGHGLWQRRFGADPGIVGQKLILDGKPHVVVGIMPPEFHYLNKRGIIAPFVLNEEESKRRGATYLNVLARLKPEITLAQAQSEMDGVAMQLAQEYPQTNREMGAAVVPLSEQMLGSVRPALLILLGAVAFILLIACANVANLMLARTSVRRREFAVRAALGASRSRLVRQLLTESLALALLGCAGGIVLAVWSVGAILSISPASLPRVEQIGIDGRMLLFALGLSILTAIVFGLAPALKFSSPNLGEAVKEGVGCRGAGVIRQRLRSFLVVAEFALALILLIGAGLLIRSFARLLQVDPGFRADNALTLQVHVYDQYPSPPQQAAFFEQSLERITSLPGVEAAGAASAPPFIGEGSIEIESDFTIEGKEAPAPDQAPTAYHTVVTSGYFSALGIKLVEGRFFDKFDHAGGAPVALINETMARRYFAGENPVGKKIVVRRLTKPVAREIVGVVGDVRHLGLDSDPRPEIFLHHQQVPFGSMTFIVRTRDDPQGSMSAVKNEVWAVNRNLPFYSAATMNQLVSESLKEKRFSLFLLGSFAVIALILAGVGIYGVVSFTTSQRTHEIGIRVALGAQSRDILKMVIGEALLFSLMGVAAGLAGAFILTRLLKSLLFGITPTDPLTFAVIPSLLVFVALVASYLPARRATKVDPTTALRFE
ncbi:MAG TPA: ABC transporter permease [Pyrinomonadaceae bacterium]|nr:ABC transporter permease [Pyrinomonadaceae bacterium]